MIYLHISSSSTTLPNAENSRETSNIRRVSPKDQNNRMFITIWCRHCVGLNYTLSIFRVYRPTAWFLNFFFVERGVSIFLNLFLNCSCFFSFFYLINNIFSHTIKKKKQKVWKHARTLEIIGWLWMKCRRSTKCFLANI